MLSSLSIHLVTGLSWPRLSATRKNGVVTLDTLSLFKSPCSINLGVVLDHMTRLFLSVAVVSAVVAEISSHGLDCLTFPPAMKEGCLFHILPPLDIVFLFVCLNSPLGICEEVSYGSFALCFLMMNDT